MGSRYQDFVDGLVGIIERQEARIAELEAGVETLRAAFNAVNDYLSVVQVKPPGPEACAMFQRWIECKRAVEDQAARDAAGGK